MNNLIGRLKNINSSLLEKYSSHLLSLIEILAEKNAPNVIEYVEAVRDKYPGISDDSLARNIISRLSLKAGATGAVLGLGGPLLSGLAIPIELRNTFKIQADMAMSIAYVYGHEIRKKEIVTHLLFILAGSAGLEAIKKKGIKIWQELTVKAVEKYITSQMTAKINDFISKIIIKKIGADLSLKSFKLAALAGIPIGFFFDYFGTRLIGMRSMQYYRGAKNMIIKISNVSDFIKERAHNISDIAIDDDIITIRFTLLKNAIRSSIRMEYIGYVEGSLTLMLKGNALKKNIVRGLKNNFLRDFADYIAISNKGMVNINIRQIIEKEYHAAAGINILDIRISGGELIIEL